jgi:hypothetical protein
MLFYSNGLWKHIAVRSKAPQSRASLRIYCFLTKHMAGNKSGALLLTIFELSNGRSNFAFTMRDPHKLMPPGIADHSRGAHHKHLPEIAVTGFRDAAKRSFPPLELLRRQADPGG